MSHSKTSPPGLQGALQDSLHQEIVKESQSIELGEPEIIHSLERQMLNPCWQTIFHKYPWLPLVAYTQGIRSYNFLDTNIFGYLFVSTFWIRIYSDIRLWQDFDLNIFGYLFV